jgi:hypothetical protein
MLARLLAVPPLLASSGLGRRRRVAPEGHVPRPATIAGVPWLVGDWVGSGIDGAGASEV